MADTVGIRDDMYIGKGNKYMHDFSSRGSGRLRKRCSGTASYTGKSSVRYRSPHTGNGRYASFDT